MNPMNIEEARDQMIKQQIRAWNVLDPFILDLITNTPREEFVPTEYRNLAFADTNIPLNHNQLMLTPKEEARILQALQIKQDERVLEIGTGSGYFTALMAKQAKSVVSVDIFPDFVQQAAVKLQSCDIQNVDLRIADAAEGYTQDAPYDLIVITGSLKYLPNVFRNTLNINGRLFAIIGDAPAMEATLLTYNDKQQWQSEFLFETVVPSLINARQPNPFIF